MSKSSINENTSARHLNRPLHPTHTSHHLTDSTELTKPTANKGLVVLWSIFLLTSGFFQLYHWFEWKARYNGSAALVCCVLTASCDVISVLLLVIRVKIYSTQARISLILICAELCSILLSTSTKIFYYNYILKSRPLDLLSYIEVFIILSGLRLLYPFRIVTSLGLSITLVCLSIANFPEEPAGLLVTIHGCILIIIVLVVTYYDRPLMSLPPRKPNSEKSGAEFRSLVDHIPDLVMLVDSSKTITYQNRALLDFIASHNCGPTQTFHLLRDLNDLQLKQPNRPLQEWLLDADSVSKISVSNVSDNSQIRKRENWKHQSMGVAVESTPSPLVKTSSHNQRRSRKESRPSDKLEINLDFSQLLKSLLKGLEQYEELAGGSMLVLFGKWRSESQAEACFEIKITLSNVNQQKMLLVTLSEISAREKVFRLEEINNFKNRLLGSFSHELRTPLNGNLNFLQSAHEDEEFPELLKQRYITPALNCAQLLAFLVNDILDYSQLSMRCLTLNLSTQNLHQVIKSILSVVELQAKQKRLSLTYKIHANVPLEIRTDFNRLKQILINLLKNALHQTYTGEISLSVVPRENCSGSYRFMVKDTGTAIREQDKPNIERLLQGAQTKDGYEDVFQESLGSNLGLKIATQLAQLLGTEETGGVRFRSHAEGSVFYFYVEDREDPADHLDIEFSTVRDFQLRKSAFQTHLDIWANGNNTRANFNDPTSHLRDSAQVESFVNENPEVSEIRIFGPKDSGDMFKYSLPPTAKPKFEEQKKDELLLASTDNICTTSQSLALRIKSELTIKDDKKSRSPSRVRRIPLQVTREILGLEETDRNVCRCRCILIVDDDPFNILSLGMMLKKLGFEYEEVYNGQIAVEKIGQKERCCSTCKLYSMVFMDCNMPVKDGYEATIELRQKMHQDELPHIPIVACTAYVIDYQNSRCKEVGMDEYLYKPVDRTLLTAVLKRWALLPS